MPERPSLAEAFAATRQAEAIKRVERAAPKAWKAGRVTQDGNTTVTTSPYDASEPSPEEWQLLEDHGFDPARYHISGPIKSSTWTAYLPKNERTEGEFTFTAKAFKFNVVERPADLPPIEELEELIYGLPDLGQYTRGINTSPIVPLDQDKPYVVALGDLQIGKLENPTDELIVRYWELMHEAAAPAALMKDRGMKLRHIHLPWLGDCIEGMNSQGGRLRWRTTLPVTEQVRILRRLMMMQIELFAPLAERLTIVSVPGNHDEANSRDLDTRSDDSWAIDALDAVTDALQLAPERYGHVEAYVPGRDEIGVVLEVGDTVVAHIHGHQYRHGKHYDWWEGQTFNGQPYGQAQILLQGHSHHWQVEERGHRKWMCVPAVERESIWFKQKTGIGGSPGVLTFQLSDGRISNLTKLEPRVAA